MRKSAPCALIACLVWPLASFAQQTPVAEELLRLVPAETSVCLLVQDLRGHAANFARSPWARILKESPIGVAVMQGAELKQLAKLQDDLIAHLGLTWPQLRDDILGDGLVFAFRHGSKPADEQGVFLLKARDAALLAQLVERLNKLQKKSGELKDLLEREHKGMRYYRRVEKDRDHYYLVQGPLLVLSGKEALLQQVIDIQKGEAKAAPALEQFRRAAVLPAKPGKTGALAALWVNPRSFDAELAQSAEKAGPVEGHPLKQFLGVWKALDGLVVSFTPAAELELALTVQGRANDLPEAIRPLFTTPTRPSGLWRRFPPDAVVTVAGRVDAPALLQALTHFVPEAERKKLATVMQAGSAALGLDIPKDVLPNLGPDWGFCLAAAPDPKDTPHLIAALAVKPGDNGTDRALLQGVLDFTRMAVLAYNLKNTDPIHLKTVRQGKIEVNYLANDKLFPPGVRPAVALKDGYLVFASCPEAIERFVLRKEASPPLAGSGVPLASVSFTEAARLLKHHRRLAADWIADKNQIAPTEAGKMLDGLLAILSLFDRLTLSQRSGDGRIVWTVRLTPGR